MKTTQNTIFRDREKFGKICLFSKKSSLHWCWSRPGYPINLDPFLSKASEFFVNNYKLFTFFARSPTIANRVSVLSPRTSDVNINDAAIDTNTTWVNNMMIGNNLLEKIPTKSVKLKNLSDRIQE